MLEGSGLGELLVTHTIKNLAFRGVGFLLNVEFTELISRSTNDAKFNGTHLVLGQSSRLVRADDASAAKSLNGGKSTDDAVVGRHLASAESQTGCDDGGQTFGDGSNSEGNSEGNRQGNSEG